MNKSRSKKERIVKKLWFNMRQNAYRIQMIKEGEHMTKEQNDCIEYLKKSPSFASSLGSKELFHSNIWAYLIEQDKRFLKVFFEDEYNPNDPNSTIILDDESGEKARREKYHMDLLVVTNTSVYVIENKIKSIPYKEQLDNYNEVIEKQFGNKKQFFCLTGIRSTGPSFLKENASDWKYLSYQEISKGIIKTVESSVNEERYHLFAREYAEMISKLSKLLVSGIEGVKNLFYFPQFKKTDNLYSNIDLITNIEKLRMGDIFQKMNAERFVQEIEEKIPQHGFQDNPKCRAGFTRKYSLAEFFFERTRPMKKNNKKLVDEYIRIGVQIQETQFRWYIETYTNYEIKADSVFDLGTELNWFDKNKSKNKQIKCPGLNERATTMKKSYGSFQTKNDTFVYQYFNIQDCKFESLASMVLNYLECAEKLVDNVERWFRTNDSKLSQSRGRS